MKKTLYLASAIAFMACGSNKKNVSSTDANVDQAAKFATSITAKDLGKHLFMLQMHLREEIPVSLDRKKQLNI